MSSILEALKKAESESSKRDQVQIRSGKLALTGQPRSTRRFRFKWVFVAVGITAAAIVVWIFKPSATVSTSAKIQSYRIAPPKKKASQKPPDRNQRKTPSKDTKQTTVRRPPIKTATRGRSGPVHPGAPPGSTRTKAPLPRHIPQKTVSRPAPQPQPPVYQRSGHGLTLQAIAWDPDAKKRFAVINNQIIREGQTVDSKVVERIGQDEIVVARGSERWKIDFRIE